MRVIAGTRKARSPAWIQHYVSPKGEVISDHPHNGHANLGTTSIYLQGIDPEEIITAVRTRRGPVMSASAGLRL
jgi:hypothetical protein